MPRRQVQIYTQAVRPGWKQPSGGRDRAAQMTTMIGRTSAYGDRGAVLPANEKRLSDAESKQKGRHGGTLRQINLVGLNRRACGGYGDCKVERGDVNRLAWANGVGLMLADRETEQESRSHRRGRGGIARAITQLAVGIGTPRPYSPVAFQRH